MNTKPMFLYIQIGKVNAVFYLDCEEYYCTQRLLHRGQKTDRIDDNLGAISKRITFFKDNTLPVVKYYDDMGRVFVVRSTIKIFFIATFRLCNWG